MLLLPSPAFPAYNVITTIDGVDYELVYTYDEHRDLWRFGVNNERGDTVMGHRPLLPFVQMRPNAFASALEGVFALIAPLPTDDAYEALTGGLWSVVYGLPAEIAELTDSLSDLAGDADTPVVPIEVIYPPNNAILSNPVVTFSGTGPANQLLFARGESIHVDSMGGWVWTHTFSESNPVVVFEGESGQRATVRLSIIMQPLTIDPVGKDIDGTRYAFTEDVEITGTATPNSAIIVNGQPVGVGGDGLWSTVLALSAGQSHTITAQGGDGQVAQASVYVWGEPDLLALQPPVWLDPTDVATLFIDSAGTTPVQFSGDPVGLWVNKGTLGAVGDAAQPVSASRPVWTDAGGGVVVFDGAQYIRLGMRLSTPFELAIAKRETEVVSSNYRGVFGSRVRGNSTRSVYANVRPIGNAVAVYIRGDSSTAENLSVENIQKSILNIRRHGDTTEASSGGALSVSDASIGDFETLEYVDIGVVLNNFYDGSMGHVLIFDRILTTEERAQLLQWMEAKHGI